MNLTNQMDRLLDAFEVWLSQGDLSSKQVVLVSGIQTMVNHLQSVSVMQILICYIWNLEMQKYEQGHESPILQEEIIMTMCSIICSGLRE